MRSFDSGRLFLCRRWKLQVRSPYFSYGSHDYLTQASSWGGLTRTWSFFLCLICLSHLPWHWDSLLYLPVFLDLFRYYQFETWFTYHKSYLSKCIIFSEFTFIRLCEYHHYPIPGHFYHPYPLAVNYYFPPPNNYLLYVSMNLSIWNISYTWIYTIYSLVSGFFHLV